MSVASEILERWVGVERSTSRKPDAMLIASKSRGDPKHLHRDSKDIQKKAYDQDLIAHGKQRFFGDARGRYAGLQRDLNRGERRPNTLGAARHYKLETE